MCMNPEPHCALENIYELCNCSTAKNSARSLRQGGILHGKNMEKSNRSNIQHRITQNG